MTAKFSPPKLYDTPFPDLLALTAQLNPNRDVVQIIREYKEAPTDSIHVKWPTFIQQVQIAAADLRHRWSSSLTNDDAKRRIADPRLPGDALVVVGLLASSGYQYYVNMFACIFNRWTVLLISPKNSPEAIEHLLRVSHSSLLLVEPNAVAFGRTMESSISGLCAHTLATLEEPLGGPAPSPLTPLTPTQIEAEMKLPAFYMHTSGSTGHPKIIPWNHYFLLSGSRSRQRDGDEFIGAPFYSIPPLSHALGMFAYVMYLPAHGNVITFISSPTPKPPSAAAFLEHLPFIQGGVVTLPPSIVEEIHDLGVDAVDRLAKGTIEVICGGAPLKVVTGKAIAKAGVKICSAYGSTEMCIGCRIRPPENLEDWQYVEFRGGFEWHFLPVDGDPELRELIASPGPEDTPAVINHESPRGYATNDIWSPHPSIPNLWKHHSRKGDITVLSNGEKTNNKHVESLLMEDKHIFRVLVFGTGRPVNGVIIQPADSSITVPDFLSLIEPTVRHANAILPKHSRLIPGFIIVAPPNKPFPTTDKNTVKKKATLDLFEEEIEASYVMLEQGGGTHDFSFEGNVHGESDVKTFVQGIVRTVLDHEVRDDDDLFEHGLDSLLSSRVRAALISVVKKTPTASQPLPRNITYTFPSINSLTKYLISRSTPTQNNLADDTHEQIRRTIAKYSTDLPTHEPGTRSVQGEIVALTGSTGSLGSCLVMLLLQRESVSKVYLLNRQGSGTQEKQVKALRDRGLDPSVLDDKSDMIVYMEVDLSRQDLGLTALDYAELRDNVTHIIHSAWHLNFNLVLKSYERVHVAGVRHLIELALSSPQPQSPRLIFLSSIAAAGMYNGPSQNPTQGERAGQVLIPEEPIDDPSIPLAQGYGQAKYASERILVNASKIGLRTTIIRMGQLSGIAASGVWTRNEHIPILFTSSMTLGMIPNDLPPVRWVPCDVAASAIMKQAFNRSSTLQYFHIENTFSTPWKNIAEAASRASPTPMTFVSLAAWLEYIRQSNPDPEKVTAMRLLDFFLDVARGGATVALGWQKSVEVSPELAVGPITPELVKKYILFQTK